MSQQTPFFKQLHLRNFLSYGPESQAIDCRPLNVLIGPNGSGKSNLLEALALLRAAPNDSSIAEPLREGGGVREWFWKGEDSNSKETVAQIDALLDYADHSPVLCYKLAFTAIGQKLHIHAEAIEDKKQKCNINKETIYYRNEEGNIQFKPFNMGELPGRDLLKAPAYGMNREDIDFTKSILSQIKDSAIYPELTYIGKQFGDIRLYRELNLGRYTPPRKPQPADLPEDSLLEDMSNLGLVWNHLQYHAQAKTQILKELRQFYGESLEEITTKIQGGTVQLFFHEKGRRLIPATRLSDGTLRYMALLTILCHPEPPRVVCIEEPELGLHPDVLAPLAGLMVEASQRTQLFITTHSDALVSALSSTPESILVCERDKGGTVLRRLDAEQMKEWLEKYTLGELWQMGEIGGNPW